MLLNTFTSRVGSAFLKVSFYLRLKSPGGLITERNMVVILEFAKYVEKLKKIGEMLEWPKTLAHDREQVTRSSEAFSKHCCGE